jgi:hypothetical protein
MFATFLLVTSLRIAVARKALLVRWDTPTALENYESIMAIHRVVHENRCSLF